jgi:hypothetical protein
MSAFSKVIKLGNVGEMIREHIAAELDDYAIPAKDGKKRTKVPPKTFDATIPLISNQKDLETLCTNTKSKNLCVITFFDPNAKEKSRETDLKIAQEVKKQLFEKGVKDIQFVKCDGIPEGVKQDFGVPDGLPGMLVIHPKKKVYRTFLGAFDEKPLFTFIDETSRGLARGVRYEFEPSFAGRVEKPHTKDEL